METFSETFSSKIVGTLPLPASGTKLYAVHIAFVGGGGGLYYAIKVSQVGKKPNSDTFCVNN